MHNVDNYYGFFSVSFFKGHADEITSMRHTGSPTDQKFLEWLSHSFFFFFIYQFSQMFIVFVY